MTQLRPYPRHRRAESLPEPLIDLRVPGLRLVIDVSASLRTVIGGLLATGMATLMGYFTGIR
ncbi:hypothetical protein [Streptomyces sp. NPDC001404]|uniref:hypothetical protein n=1 Tax=Streptomyces sp. NPDC001404 TaxID=3364571 RepID=UPI00367DD657